MRYFIILYTFFSLFFPLSCVSAQINTIIDSNIVNSDVEEIEQIVKNFDEVVWEKMNVSVSEDLTIYVCNDTNQFVNAIQKQLNIGEGINVAKDAYIYSSLSQKALFVNISVGKQKTAYYRAENLAGFLFRHLENTFRDGKRPNINKVESSGGLMLCFG